MVPLPFSQKIANKREEAVLNFSINTTPITSWANAVALASITGAVHDNYIIPIDNLMVTIAKRVMNPGFLYRCYLSRSIGRRAKM